MYVCSPSAPTTNHRIILIFGTNIILMHASAHNMFGECSSKAMVIRGNWSVFLLYSCVVLCLQLWEFLRKTNWNCYTERMWLDFNWIVIILATSQLKCPVENTLFFNGHNLKVIFTRVHWCFVFPFILYFNVSMTIYFNLLNQLTRSKVKVTSELKIIITLL